MPESSFIIVGLGELLWDLFPDERRPGGAPANVAYHASALGNTGIIASRVGEDDAGNKLLQFLQSKMLNVSYIQKDRMHATGEVTVEISDGEPAYTITEDVAWDFLEFTGQLKNLARKADAVCFGTLAQRSGKSQKTIRKFLEMVSRKTLRILDINLRTPFYSKDVISKSIELADVIKLNKDEYENLQELFGVVDPIRWLLEEKEIDIVCLTKGKDGSELITKRHRLEQLPRILDVSKGDTVGVGDAFTAALAVGLLNGRPHANVLKFANSYAGHIATRKGGMPGITDFNRKFPER